MWSVLRRLQQETDETGAAKAKKKETYYIPEHYLQMYSSTANSGESHHQGKSVVNQKLTPPPPPDPETRARNIAKNLHTIARHTCRGINPRVPPATVFTVAYGDGVYDKINETLLDPGATTDYRLQALDSLLSFVYVPKENTYLAVTQAGLLDTLLVHALHDGNDSIRLSACHCLQAMGTQLVALEHIQSLLDDLIKVIQQETNWNARQGIMGFVSAFAERAAMAEEGKHKQFLVDLLDSGAVPLMIQYLRSAVERLDALEVTHETRSELSILDGTCSGVVRTFSAMLSVKEAFLTLLDAYAMETLVEFLRPTRTRKWQLGSTIIHSLTLLSQIAFFTAGKRAAVRCGVLPMLHELYEKLATLHISSPRNEDQAGAESFQATWRDTTDMSHDSHLIDRVLTECTACYMAMCINNDAKKVAMECGVLHAVCKFLEKIVLVQADSTNMITVQVCDLHLLRFSIQYLCIMSENLRARNAMTNIVPQLECLARAKSVEFVTHLHEEKQDGQDSRCDDVREGKCTESKSGEYLSIPQLAQRCLDLVQWVPGDYR